jgi:hypothetical protein
MPSTESQTTSSSRNTCSLAGKPRSPPGEDCYIDYSLFKQSTSTFDIQCSNTTYLFRQEFWIVTNVRGATIMVADHYLGKHINFTGTIPYSWWGLLVGSMPNTRVSSGFLAGSYLYDFHRISPPCCALLPFILFYFYLYLFLFIYLFVCLFILLWFFIYSFWVFIVYFLPFTNFSTLLRN